MALPWTTHAELTLHPDATRLVDANREGFDFLGYHLGRGKHWPRDESLMKFKDATLSKTPRKHGQSWSVIIASVNRTTSGWAEYFKHTSYTSVFRILNGLIRRRLRRILLKRHLQRNHNGMGMVHYRLLNPYFAEQGLFSMEAAHVRVRQSVVR